MFIIWKQFCILTDTSIMDPKTTSAAETYLAKHDTKLGKLIAQNGSIVREPRQDYFASLARAIVGQQISVKAAASIFARLEELTQLKPENVVALSEEDIKAIGLSRPKARYIQDLAQHFVEDSAVYNHLESLNDDQVIQELTAVKGIGVWTAQMFLMFTLVRPDVFAPDDVGLQKAIKKLYGLAEVPPRSELEKIAERWQPYRTIASWHLWHMLDNEPK
jgi:DNA-3-methyladenine glycosylase II